MKKCEHKNIVKDHFADLVGVSGGSPDRLYCLDCKEPVYIKGTPSLDEQLASQEHIED